MGPVSVPSTIRGWWSVGVGMSRMEGIQDCQ